MNTTTPEAAQALEALRVAGFRISTNTGAYRLLRSDGSQAEHGHLGNITDVTFDHAAVKGLAVAQAILKDEAQRLAMPRPQLGKEGSWIPTQG